MSGRVLITGSVGFIGHHVAARFIRDGYEVVGLDRLSHSGNMNRMIIPHKVFHHDLRSEINGQLSKQLGTFDYIFHIAASSHVDRSIESPRDFVLDNVLATCNILEFARVQPALKMFVYFSTDEVFGPAPPGVSYGEFDRYNCTNPYSATKAGGEELAVAYQNTYHMPIVITHTMNVFGPRQHAEKFIPMCINKIRNGETIEIHSDAKKENAGSRFYIHAEDVADALAHIINIPRFDATQKYQNMCQKFNIVGKEEVDNLSLATMIAGALGREHFKYELVDFHSARPGHDLRYALSGERLMALGWWPKKSVRDRIKEVVEWSINNPEWM